KNQYLGGFYTKLLTRIIKLGLTPIYFIIFGVFVFIIFVNFFLFFFFFILVFHRFNLVMKFICGELVVFTIRLR
ncbi:hypothetical protein ACJBYZ_10845, partial [Streptococcus suis]